MIQNKMKLFVNALYPISKLNSSLINQLSLVNSPTTTIIFKRQINSYDHRRVDWDHAALKYLRYIGVDIPNLVRIYKRMGRSKSFDRDRLVALVEFLDQIGVRGNSIKNVILQAPDLLRINSEVLEIRMCWYRHVFGLSYLEMRDMVIDFPNILEDDVTARFEETLKYFNELGITREQFRSMIIKSPKILGRPVDGKIDEGLNFFIDRGITNEELVQCLLSFPETITLTLNGHIIPKLIYLKGELRVTDEEFCKAFIKYPWILGLSLENGIKVTIQWLLDFGVSKEALGRVILKYPPILGYSIENNFKPKLDYFIHYLGIPFGKIARIIEEYPTFLSASLKENIRPMIWYFEHELLMPIEDVRNVFLALPQLFHVSFTETIKPIIDYFKEIGSRPEILSKAIVKFPQILTFSLEDNIKVKVNWLLNDVGISEEDIGFIALHKIYLFSIDTLNERINHFYSLNFSKDEIIHLITKDASILHKSKENITLKYEFLKNEYLKENVVNEEILKFPNILGYSYAQRLKPRFDYIYQKLSKEEGDELIQYKSLEEMFSIDDKEFIKFIPDEKMTDYLKFKENYLITELDEEISDFEINEFENVKMKKSKEINPIEEFRESEKRFSRNFMDYKLY